MSIFNATSLKYTKDNKTWSSEGAMQGCYGDGALRTGAMLFDTIRDVDWENQIITQIDLTLKFGPVGSEGKKIIKLYMGAKNSIGGTGASMRGLYIGGFTTNGGAYSNTTTNTFVPGSEVFEGLVNWLKTASTKTLAMYKWEETNGGWSPNYLRVTAATLNITHEPAGSGFTLDKESVDAGASIALSIEPLENATGVLTHDVIWSMGDRSETQELSAGMHASEFEIPLEWLETIPSAKSGPAYCTLATYEGGTLRGSRTIEFIVTAPDSVAPVFSVSGESTLGGQKYYQYISQAVLKITGVDTKYGTDVASYSISGGEGESGSGSSLTTGYFKNAGKHSYQLTVTDRRGLSSTLSVEINVTAVALPKITAFDVQRYSEINDGETIQYPATDYGNKVKITAQGTWDPAGNNNIVTAYIEYYPVGNMARAAERIDLSAVGGNLDYVNDRTVIEVEIPIASAYVFELYLGDLANSANAADSVAKGRCNVHYAGSGYGVGFGGFAQGTEENPMLQSWYPGYFYEGIHGVNIYSAEEIDTGGVWIDGKKIYRRVFADGNVPKSTDNQGTSLGTIAGLGTVVDMRGIFTESASVSQKPIPYYYATDMRIVTGTRATDGENAVFIVTTVAGSAFVIVDYTKT